MFLFGGGGPVWTSGKRSKAGPGRWYLCYRHRGHKIQRKNDYIHTSRYTSDEAREELKATNKKAAIVEAKAMWAKIVNQRPPFHEKGFDQKTGYRLEDKLRRDPHEPRIIFEIVLKPA